MDAQPLPVHVLTVCTGNICRSPAAHLLLADALGPDSGVTVSSAGVMALVGEPVSASMAELLESAGVATRGFTASYLTATDVRQATLVLGLTRAHRSKAVTLAPPAVRRSFTLKEFARLVERVPAEDLAARAGSDTPAARLRALAELAGRHRSPVPADQDDIVDPYGRERAVYAAVFAEIRAAVETIARITLGR